MIFGSELKDYTNLSTIYGTQSTKHLCPNEEIVNFLIYIFLVINKTTFGTVWDPKGSSTP